MGKRKSLAYQVKTTLSGICCYGRSKHQDKRAGNNYHPHGIYSVKTYETYTRQCLQFTAWCKDRHSCRTLQECQPYIIEYLQEYAEGKSPSSIHTAKYALQKLYDALQHGYKIEFTHDRRERSRITKNRGGIESVQDFNEKKHLDLLTFAASCGLRRHELLNLRYQDVAPDGAAVTVQSGKGGKTRTAQVLPENRSAILARLSRLPEPDPAAHIWTPAEIPSRTPIHRCRRIYAQTLYKALARDPKDIPPEDRYICRKDKRGVIYDRRAMLQTSQALGHNRLDVIAISYL